ncbi:MAG: pyrroline-5-carboxylate reductase [Candidatus Marinimicrobia bacterium]|jgi:pyrroline-5-carboxylate reductase|nr:pyrroline-5-carboxylate reductase [Alphaproteobacteria bacterium]MBT5782836.1 pyrroline-5-carboxylate reductase [Candidatus Neomarinimicrobiota bacterium]
MKALQKLLILGSGKMGSSLLKGLISNNELNFDISVVEPNLTKDNDDLISENKIKYFQSIENIKGPDFDIILFAVKPQVINEVCSGVIENLNQEKTFSIISILAGTTVKTFEGYFSPSPIIRAMPNLAVSEGSGVTALYGNINAGKAFKDTSDKIFSGVGEVIWVDSEDMMDVITATSGSGPAYYFFLTECLSLIAEEMGLSKENADKLSRQVAIGSSDIMKSSNESLTNLREKVTSKGGTTEAALEILMSPDKEFYNIFKQALKNAYKKSKDLSS